MSDSSVPLAVVRVAAATAIVVAGGMGAWASVSGASIWPGASGQSDEQSQSAADEAQSAAEQSGYIPPELAPPGYDPSAPVDSALGYPAAGQSDEAQSGSGLAEAAQSGEDSESAPAAVATAPLRLGGHTFSVSPDSRAVSLYCPPGQIDPLDPAGTWQEPSLLRQQDGAESGSSEAGSGKSDDPSKGSVLDLGHLSTGDLLSTGLSIGGGATETRASLLLAECQFPASDLLLVAGDVAVAEDTVLVLGNPGSEAIKVEVTGYSASGPLKAAPPAIQVPAASAVAVLPGAWLPDSDRLALQLHTDDAGMTAWLQTSGREGEVEQGLARASATPPADTLVFPGVSEALAAPSLRLLNPTTEELPVKIETVTGGERQQLPGTADLSVAPGAVFEVPLAGIGDDPVAVVVTAEHPFGGSISSQVPGAADPVVSDQKRATRQVDVPSPPTRAIAVPDVAGLERDLDERGLREPQVTLSLVNNSDETVEVTGDADGPAGTNKRQIAPDSNLVLSGKDLAELGGQLASDGPISASLQVTAKTDQGTVFASTPVGVTLGQLGTVDVTLWG